jgi:hypothetical protein
MKEAIVTDGDCFTRETWRRGKKFRRRKRQKPYGGRKTAPPAFLEAAKVAGFKPGRPGYKICRALKRDGNPCGNLALKALTVCGPHGGFGILARQGKLQPTGKSAAIRAARAAAVEDRTPAAPFELIRLALYRQADQRVRMRLIRAWGTSGWLSLVRQIQADN